MFSNGNSDGSDVYMIGDSDTVLSESYIKEELPNITINAQSSIWFAESQPGLVSGVDRIKEMGNQNILVFALGSNGGITNDDINKLLDVTKDKDLKIILTTIYYANGFAEKQMNSSNEVVKKAAEDYDNISYMDWYAAASADPAKYMESDNTVRIILQCIQQKMQMRTYLMWMIIRSGRRCGQMVMKKI